MSEFNRGSTGAGRRRSLGLMPGESTGEGTPGNVIPRGTTLASIRRGQALLRMLNDRLPDGQEFSRGATASGRRRNFSLMALLEEAGPTTGVQVYLTSQTVNGPGNTISWTGENYDYGDWWTAGGSLTCPTDGTYQFDYEFTADHVPGGGINVIVTKNGSTYNSQTFGVTAISASLSIAMVAGDVFTIVFQTMASTIITDGLCTIT